MAGVEVYCDLRHEQAIDTEGKNINHPRLWGLHQKMVPLLQVINVQHVSFENPESEHLVLRQGQAVVHKDLVDTFKTLFNRWLDLRYPIEHFIPISQAPDSSDAYAMGRNWSLVYRPDVIGSPDDLDASHSEHYRASAVDVNQLDNPMIYPDHTIEPREAINRLPRLGMVLLRNLEVVNAAKELGFEWGNDWPDPRAGDGYYGIGKDGRPRHILRDSHHMEVIPSLAEQLAMPSPVAT